MAAAIRRGLSPTPPVRLRLDTTDVAVYVDVLLDEEYAFDYPVEPRVIVDAGSHIGLATVWFARRFPSATIVALEMEPANFALLEANARRFPNVHVLHAALWPSTSTISVVDSDVDTWAYQAVEGGDVEALTVDDVMKRFEFERIDLLKLDVEGAEREIFATSARWIDRVEMIVAELHDRYREGCTAAFEEATASFLVRAVRGENVLAAR